MLNNINSYLKSDYLKELESVYITEYSYNFYIKTLQLIK